MVEAAAASVPTNPFVATPALPGGFGVGPLGNPTSASLINFTTNATGFTAQLLLQNGSSGSTHAYVTSCGDAIGIVEVPLPAGGVQGSTAGCFTNGIENDPLTGGSRLLEWNTSSATVANFSNTGLNITSQWISVSGHYGFAAGPGGHFRYRAASGYNRLGAAQDYLAWIPTARVSARYAVWFPGRTTAQTATLAGEISWTTNGSTVLLSFPAGGSNVTISASQSSGNGTWSSDASGNWSDPSKWSAGSIADGTGSTANFSTVNLTTDRTVTLDSSRNIGVMDFGDTSGTNNWFLNSSGGSVLTLSAGTPSIVVNQNTATLNVPLAGTVGFTKSGPGTLVLAATNSLSGTLNLDSASTTANDGAVRLTTSAAVGNVSSLVIRNNTGANVASTLQLDGTAGSVVVAPDFTMACRANLIPNVENLAGSNTISGNILMQAGGSNVVFQSDAGTLVLTGALQYIGTLTAGRAWNFLGAGDTLAAGTISSAANGAPISVGRFAAGTLFLRGANSFDAALNLAGGVVNFQTLDNLGADSATLNFNGGTLQYAPANTTDISSRTVTFNVGATIDTGTNNVVFAQAIGNGGSGGLTKLGAGSLTLNAAAAFTGPVTVTAGILGGAGPFSGSVTISPSGTLAPGGIAPGVLTINNSLTNHGTLFMRLSKSGAARTNDTIQGVTGVACGGTLQLVAQGDPLVAGDSFHLFYTTNFTGSFSAITPANAPGPGLAWDHQKQPLS